MKSYIIYYLLLLIIKMQDIIYPSPPSECPRYLDSNPIEWENKLKIANGFGVKEEYDINDVVEYISFWYPSSQIHQRNHVIIQKVQILEINLYSNNKYYGLKYLDNSGFNSGAHMRNLRPCK